MDRYSRRRAAERLVNTETKQDLEEQMPIEHLGLGVPDVDAAKVYYDELMPIVGFQPCFGNGYCPEDFQGAQLFLYPTRQAGKYSRHGVGLQHIAFLVRTRAEVHRVHDWAKARGDEIVRAPNEFPQYGPHCYATFFLDPHGFMIEVVSHDPQAQAPVRDPFDDLR